MLVTPVFHRPKFIADLLFSQASQPYENLLGKVLKQNGLQPFANSTQRSEFESRSAHQNAGVPPVCFLVSYGGCNARALQNTFLSWTEVHRKWKAEYGKRNMESGIWKAGESSMILVQWSTYCCTYHAKQQ